MLRLPLWRRLRYRLARRLQEFLTEGDFIRFGGSAEETSIDGFDSLFRLLEARQERLRGQAPSLLFHERAIQQKQRLLRDGRLMTLRAADVGRREVERAEHTRQVLSVDETVNRSSCG